jgi:hypothetical protein
MREEDYFDLGMDIVCINDYRLIPKGATCRITGCGDMKFLYGEKDGFGYGFSVDYQKAYYDHKSSRYATSSISYILSLDRMFDYFATIDDYYKIHRRQDKIESILK